MRVKFGDGWVWRGWIGDALGDCPTISTHLARPLGRWPCEHLALGLVRREPDGASIAEEGNGHERVGRSVLRRLEQP